MPTAHTDAHGSREDEDLLEDRPITLIDIARVLGRSAGVGRSGDALLIRAWRDDLTLIDEALTYARSVLAADLAILTQAGPRAAVDPETVIEDLPAILASGRGEGQGSGGGGEELELDLELNFDEGLFVRTDHLLAPHREMARIDLAVPGARARVVAIVEEQLAILTERQAAVEARLQQIRAVIIRQYRDAAASPQDQSA